MNRRIACLSVTALLLCVVGTTHAEPFRLRVMTLNILAGGERLGQPLSQTVKVIEAAQADIVGMQECFQGERDSSAVIAKELGWQHFYQGGRTSVLSRWPIVGHTPRKWGVSVRLPSGQVVSVFNVHFAPAPYQPYQFARIPYGDYPFIKTEGQALYFARKARGHQVDSLFKELKPTLADGVTCFLTGDFNEPSFQDWTDRAADAGRVPLSVVYPATKRVSGAGMVDGYRKVFPNELTHRGWTWTPMTKPTDPMDRHDRIDYVFSSQHGVTAHSAAVVGESKEFADIVVTPWPTDHRGVVVEYELADTNE